MSKKTTEGSVSKKTKINRGQLRELFTEQMMRAIEKRGFVDELFRILDQIEDPVHKLRCALELLKFVMPQLASQHIKVESADTPVTHVVFQPAIAKEIDVTPPKLVNE